MKSKNTCIATCFSVRKAVRKNTFWSRSRARLRRVLAPASFGYFDSSGIRGHVCHLHYGLCYRHFDDAINRQMAVPGSRRRRCQTRAGQGTDQVAQSLSVLLLSCFWYSLCRLFGQMDFIPEVDLNHVGSEVVMDLETLVSSRC